MAEINVVPTSSDVVSKEGSHVWLWIGLTAVTLALLIWAFSGRMRSAAFIEQPQSSNMAQAAAAHAAHGYMLAEV